MWLELPQLYWVFALLRVVLVFIPQLGYIHPDEYFQSIEVLAGKALQVEYNAPWEFNSSFPIRSMTVPYFTTGMVYSISNIIDVFLRNFFTKSIITPYLVVVGPRLLMLISSFFVDFTIYKICVENNEKYKNKLVVLASSYVMIVYATRTFSNTIELILFALLQYFVCESLVFSNILLKKREYLNYRYKTSKSVVEKVKFHKLRLFLTSDSLRNCFYISTVTVLGFFNRPTFLAFALFPVFFWLYRGIVPTLLFSVFVDSFYYGYLTWGEIGVFQISIDNFIFTPLNFLKYNLNASNLAKHGLHPRFLHILVNMPLLFNILWLFAVYGFVKTCYNFVIGKRQLLPSVRSIKGLMMLSYVAPLALLSIFPHQEPRFIIPLIIPLVYLYSSSLLPEYDNILVKLETLNVDQVSKASTKRESNVLFKLWLLINVILAIFYGFLHQGGVYPAANYLSKEINFKYPTTDYHIFTSHIYSIPESLFLQKSTNKLHQTAKTKYVVTKRLFLYEEGSLDLSVVINNMKLVYWNCLKRNKKFRLLLVIPSSLAEKLHFNNDSRLDFSEIITFYPHISTEAFPEWINDIFLIKNFQFDILFESAIYYYSKIISSFGLTIYTVIPQKH